LWVISSRTTEVVADVELRFISISTGKDIKAKITKHITVTVNGSIDVAHGVIDNFSEEPHVLAARLWIDGVCVSRDMDWPQPLKYLSFGDQGVEVSQHGDELRILAMKPTKGLTFEEREGLLVSDSTIDLAPGEQQVITCSGLKAGEKMLSWTYLGKHD
jgi:beta-mannosidase